MTFLLAWVAGVMAAVTAADLSTVIHDPHSELAQDLISKVTDLRGAIATLAVSILMDSTERMTFLAVSKFLPILNLTT